MMGKISIWWIMLILIGGGCSSAKNTQSTNQTMPDAAKIDTAAADATVDAPAVDSSNACVLSACSGAGLNFFNSVEQDLKNAGCTSGCHTSSSTLPMIVGNALADCLTFAQLTQTAPATPLFPLMQNSAGHQLMPPQICPLVADYLLWYSNVTCFNAGSSYCAGPTCNESCL